MLGINVRFLDATKLRHYMIATLIIGAVLTASLSFLASFYDVDAMGGEQDDVVAIYGSDGAAWLGKVPYSLSLSLRHVEGVTWTSGELIAAGVVRNEAVFLRGVIQEDLHKVSDLKSMVGNWPSDDTTEVSVGVRLAQRFGLDVGDMIEFCNLEGQRVYLSIVAIHEYDSQLDDELISSLKVARWFTTISVDSVTVVRVKIDDPRFKSSLIELVSQPQRVNVIPTLPNNTLDEPIELRIASLEGIIIDRQILEIAKPTTFDLNFGEYYLEARQSDIVVDRVAFRPQTGLELSVQANLIRRPVNVFVNGTLGHFQGATATLTAQEGGLPDYALEPRVEKTGADGWAHLSAFETEYELEAKKGNLQVVLSISVPATRNVSVLLTDKAPAFRVASPSSPILMDSNVTIDIIGELGDTTVELSSKSFGSNSYDVIVDQFAYNETTFRILPEGKYKLYINSVSPYGSESNSTVYFAVDLGSPIVQLSIPNTTDTLHPGQSFAISVQDGTLQSAFYSWDNGNPAAIPEILHAPMSPGVHVLWIEAADIMHQTTVVNRTFCIDASLPSEPISSIEDGSWIIGGSLLQITTYSVDSCTASLSLGEQMEISGSGTLTYNVTVESHLDLMPSLLELHATAHDNLHSAISADFAFTVVGNATVSDEFGQIADLVAPEQKLRLYWNLPQSLHDLTSRDKVTRPWISQLSINGIPVAVNNSSPLYSEFQMPEIASEGEVILAAKLWLGDRHASFVTALSVTLMPLLLQNRANGATVGLNEPVIFSVLNGNGTVHVLTNAGSVPIIFNASSPYLVVKATEAGWLSISISTFITGTGEFFGFMPTELTVETLLEPLKGETANNTLIYPGQTLQFIPLSSFDSIRMDSRVGETFATSDFDEYATRLSFKIPSVAGLLILNFSITQPETFETVNVTFVYNISGPVLFTDICNSSVTSLDWINYEIIGSNATIQWYLNDSLVESGTGEFTSFSLGDVELGEYTLRVVSWDAELIESSFEWQFQIIPPSLSEICWYLDNDFTFYLSVILANSNGTLLSEEGSPGFLSRELNRTHVQLDLILNATALSLMHQGAISFEFIAYGVNGEPYTLTEGMDAISLQQLADNIASTISSSMLATIVFGSLTNGSAVMLGAPIILDLTVTNGTWSIDEAFHELAPNNGTFKMVTCLAEGWQDLRVSFFDMLGTLQEVSIQVWSINDTKAGLHGYAGFPANGSTLFGGRTYTFAANFPDQSITLLSGTVVSPTVENCLLSFETPGEDGPQAVVMNLTTWDNDHILVHWNFTVTDHELLVWGVQRNGYLWVTASNITSIGDSTVNTTLPASGGQMERTLFPMQMSHLELTSRHFEAIGALNACMTLTTEFKVNLADGSTYNLSSSLDSVVLFAWDEDFTSEINSIEGALYTASNQRIVSQYEHIAHWSSLWNACFASTHLQEGYSILNSWLYINGAPTHMSMGNRTVYIDTLPPAAPIFNVANMSFLLTGSPLTITFSAFESLANLYRNGDCVFSGTMATLNGMVLLEGSYELSGNLTDQAGNMRNIGMLFIVANSSVELNTILISNLSGLPINYTFVQIHDATGWFQVGCTTDSEGRLAETVPDISLEMTLNAGTAIETEHLDFQAGSIYIGDPTICLVVTHAHTGTLGAGLRVELQSLDTDDLVYRAYTCENGTANITAIGGEYDLTVYHQYYDYLSHNQTLELEQFQTLTVVMNPEAKTIELLVIFSNGSLVSNALFALESPYLAQETVGVTDAFGRASIPGIPADSATLTVYLEETHILVFDAGESRHVQFEIKTTSGETVVVRYLDYDVPYSFGSDAVADLIGDTRKLSQSVVLIQVLAVVVLLVVTLYSVALKTVEDAQQTIRILRQLGMSKRRAASALAVQAAWISAIGAWSGGALSWTAIRLQSGFATFRLASHTITLSPSWLYIVVSSAASGLVAGLVTYAIAYGKMRNMVLASKYE